MISAPQPQPQRPPVLRQCQRYPVDFSLKVFSPGATGSTTGRSGDISVSGLSFYAPIELKAGQSIQLHFSLPHSQLMFGVWAIVQNANGFRYGVEFTRLTEREIEEIKRVCRIFELKR
jgi:PilZ domain